MAVPYVRKPPMLRQDINLYRRFEKPRPIIGFSMWRLFWFSNAAFSVFLLIIYLIYSWNNHLLNEKSFDLTQKINAKQKTFLATKSRYPSIFFSQDIAETIHKLQEGIQARGQIYQSLKNTSLFSLDLTALTRIITVNVWLTNILISNGGHAISLKGKSIGMNNLQSFLGNLSQEKTFAGYNLSINQIDNSEKDASSQNLTFEINLAKQA
jgi:Tfp pilus assembly protein PilN